VDLPIVERPLPPDPERERLGLLYLEEHQGGKPATTTIAPAVVVLHWTGGASADSAWNTFAPAALSGRPELGGGTQLNVGAHYLVDRDGTVFRLLPDTALARHTIGLNHVAIGIENVGDGGAHPLTAAQVAANALLVRQLCATLPLRWLIGHSEYRALEGTPLFVERDPAYRTVKPDPGAAFLEAVRAAVADLELQAPP
jgi:N-acetylmuramoyl-L-alanine amidase